MWMNALFTAIVGYILVVLRDLPKNLVKYIHIGFSYSVLSTNKESYEHINEWIFGLNKELINNNLNGCYKYSFGNKENFMAIDYGNYFFKIDKFTFVIVSKSIMQNNYDSHDKLTVKIIGKKKDVYKNEFLKCINVNKYENSIRIFPIPEMYVSYSVPKKSFEHVFSPHKQEIIKFLDDFVKNEKDYVDRGVIYKTGILLYGEPGSGKSTIARAIASYLNYNIHIINLKSFNNDVDLLKRISQIPKNSVVLLEDIDCILGKREDSTISEKERTLTGITLNMLDGVSSPTNVIFVATTNYKEKLDEALIRDGRFDLKVNISNLNKEYAIQMCKAWNCNENVLTDENFPINPSYLQGKILKNRLNNKKEND